MDFRLTDEQRALQAAVRDLARGRIAPRAAAIDESGEFPVDVREMLAEYDVLGIPFAPEYGGISGSALSLVLAIEEIARVCVSSSLILAVQSLGSLPIVLAGTDEQKTRFLPPLARGE